MQAGLPAIVFQTGRHKKLVDYKGFEQRYKHKIMMEKINKIGDTGTVTSQPINSSNRQRLTP